MNKGVDKVKFLSKFGTSMDKVFGETINNLKRKIYFMKEITIFH